MPRDARVFDAVQTHTGIGRLYFNMRFAQIGRYPRQHEEHSYPSERYPFNFSPMPDPFTGKNDGVMKRPDTDPLIVHCHTSSEYWERHGSMTHTDPRDGSDVSDSAQRAHVYACRFTARGDRRRQPTWVGQLPPSNFSPQPFLRACFVTDGPLGERRCFAAAQSRAAARRRAIGRPRRSVEKISQNSRREFACHTESPAAVELRSRL